MKWIVGVVLVVIVLILISGAVLTFGGRELFKTPKVEPTSTITPSTTPGLSSSTPIPATNTQIPPSWKKYVSQTHGFEIQYPEEVEVTDNLQSGVVFTRTGPTQTMGTELFDGFSVTIRREEYTENTFKEAVEARNAQIRDEPATTDVTSIQPISLQGRQGFEFTVQGLGEFKHLYIPVKDGEMLFITTMAEDSGNTGYEQTMGQMLSTLVINP